MPVLRKTYLQHLLRGTQHDLSAAHIIQLNINEHFTNAYYTVILAQIDKYAEFEQSHNQMMQGLLRFSVSNISNELLEKHVSNEHIVVDEQTIGILLFQNRHRFQPIFYSPLLKFRKPLINYSISQLPLALGLLLMIKIVFIHPLKRHKNMPNIVFLWPPFHYPCRYGPAFTPTSQFLSHGSGEETV